MVINSSVASTDLQNSRTAPAAAPAQPDAAATLKSFKPTGEPDGLNSISDDMDLDGPDAPNQSLQTATQSILNHSSIALLAQSGHSPQTVLSLLQD